MARPPGTFNFSANFEALVAAPLDARGTVQTISELTDSSLPYPYLGMLVCVTSDVGSNNGLYILTAMPDTVLSNWHKIVDATGGTITVSGVTLNGTIETIWLDNGDSFSVDLNEVQLAGVQFLDGLSTHSFQKIDTGTGTTWTPTVISGTTYNVVNVIYGKSPTAPAKVNVIVVDLVTTGATHHLISLPNTLTVNESGVIYKIIVKQANISDLSKYLLVFSSGVTGDYRIISSNIKTKYNNSYFVPLETMESIELIWDGDDFLVTNMVKQGYVSLDAKIFTEMNSVSDPLFTTNYLERNLNNLL